MKNLLITLSVAPLVAWMASQSFHQDGKRLLSSDELSTISGGVVFTDCNTTSCPFAGQCKPNGSQSVFYYNNLHTKCGFSWSSSCGSTGSADCMAKNHSNTTCTAPYGSQWVASTENFCL